MTDIREKLLILDAIGLSIGVKPISVMINEMASKSKYKAQPKPHQGSKEMARRKKQLGGVCNG